MLYKPTKKEVRQLKALHKGYKMAVTGLKMMSKAIDTRSNNDIDTFYYRAVTNLDNIIKSTYKLLEKEYIDKEFKNIIEKKTK